MNDLLAWLAVPLLAGPLLEAPGRKGAAAGRVIIAGLGLFALRQGAGSLDPGALRAIVAQGEHDAIFIGVTAGLVIAGASVSTQRIVRSFVLALPLMAGLLVALWPHLSAIAIGAAVGTLPTLIGSILAKLTGSTDLLRDQQVAVPGVGRDRLAIAIAVGALTLVAAIAGPAALALLLLVALGWIEWARNDRTAHPIGPTVASAACVGWLWLALTIAGSPLIGFRALGEAPVSPAAGEGLVLLAIAWAVALARPVSLARAANVAILLPVIAGSVHLATVHGTPEGLDHWLSAVSTLFVVLGLVGVTRRRWDDAAAAFMLLAAMRPGTEPFVIAVAFALMPAFRHWWSATYATPGQVAARLGGGIPALAAAVSATLLIGVLIRDEVLLAVILSLGLATLANRVHL